MNATLARKTSCRHTLSLALSPASGRRWSSHPSCSCGAEHGSSIIARITKNSARKETLAIRRQREQMAFERKMRRALLAVLRGQTTECVQRVANGQTPLPVDWRTRWEAEYLSAEKPFAHGAMLAGWEMSDKQFFSKEVTDTFVGIGENPALTPGVDYFTTRATQQRVDEYLERTSKLQAGTKASAIQKSWERLRDQVDPKTGTARGISSGAISKELQSAAFGFDKNYANMVARTTTNWCYNEGSRGRYIEAGVLRMEWFTASDELVCPFCAEMNERTTGTTSGFLGGNEKLTGTVQNADGSTREVAMITPEWGIEHPPLHPNCRCTLLPVITGL